MCEILACINTLSKISKRDFRIFLLANVGWNTRRLEHELQCSKIFYLLCKHNDYPLKMMLEFSSYFHYDKEYPIIKFVKIISFLGYQQRCIELMYEFLSKVKQNQLSIVYLWNFVGQGFQFSSPLQFVIELNILYL